MRTGAFTVQQALTAEAATVLKLSLSSARRRGHAQVTPLHVAATLLTSHSYSSTLLRRACLKSHPLHPASHPLQCRALDLCFNVALNRLPTNPPPSSTSSLSNALIAALKRAQAHQRRGCVELPPPPPPQPPLLAIKVELEQLILSILDDPSVSRVLKEAGFSSTYVKSNLEEEAFAFGQTWPSWPSNLYKLSSSSPPPTAQSSGDEDLRNVLAVMLRKQSKKTNTVIVGDSVSITEGIVSELKARVERGEIPDELKYAQFINLQHSYVHLMSRSDVDQKLSELRRKISSPAEPVIIYIGDLRWAVEEEPRSGSGSPFDPVEHMVAELGKLLAELRSISNKDGKRWLLATSSFQTYIKCQMRQPSLEIQWGLQAVVVPSGDLALSLQASSGLDLRFTKINMFPFQPCESKIQLYCCAECTSNFEKEASDLNSEIKDSNSLNNLPYWLQSPATTSHHKELREKWSRLCQRLHLYPSFSQTAIGKNSASHSWWSSGFSSERTKNISAQHSISFSRINPGSPSAFPDILFDKKNGIMSANQQVKTCHNLNTALLLDSATSNSHTKEAMAEMEVLKLKLQENIPWQSETISFVADALYEKRKNTSGIWLLLRGTDRIAKRRLALVVAESVCGSADRLVQINMKRIASRVKLCMDILQETVKKVPKSVFLMEEITQEHGGFIKFLIEGGEGVRFKDAIFILATSNPARFDEDAHCGSKNVMKMRLAAVDQSCKELKRKPEGELQNEQKKLKTREITLDMNLIAEEEEDEEDEAVPSDLTHETDCDDRFFPHDSIVQLTLEAGPDRNFHLSESLLAKVRRAFKEVRSAGEEEEEEEELAVDRTAMEELVECCGLYLEGWFEKWLREVFQRSLMGFKKGGKVVRLVVEGKEGNLGDFGFMGSALPRNVYVD